MGLERMARHECSCCWQDDESKEQRHRQDDEEDIRALSPHGDLCCNGV